MYQVFVKAILLNSLHL